jgi:hypothetical protein
MKKKDVPAERRVLKLNRETVRLLSIEVPDLKNVAGGFIIRSRTEAGGGC